MVFVQNDAVSHVGQRGLGAQHLLDPPAIRRPAMALSIL